jgi:dCTP deaminase
MTFWTTETFEEAGTEVIPKYDPSHVVDGSYELSMGPEGFVTGVGNTEKSLLEAPGAQLTIPPGQFALLLTEEIVHIPATTIGFISIKSRFKIHGLVNVSGFHVDPGFRGRLIFAVYNAGGNNIVVSRGESLFLLWLAALDRETTHTYSGSRMDQDSIPNSDTMALGEITFSPIAVNQRLETVEANLQTTRTLVNTVITVAGGFFGALVVGFIIFFLNQVVRDDPPPTAPRPQVTVTVTETPPFDRQVENKTSP